jgi:hypothetical protein
MELDMNEDYVLEKCCLQCGCTSTPLWRLGPKGPQTLCNACGIKFWRRSRRNSKKIKKKRKNNDAFYGSPTRTCRKRKSIVYYDESSDEDDLDFDESSDSTSFDEDDWKNVNLNVQFNMSIMFPPKLRFKKLYKESNKHGNMLIHCDIQIGQEMTQ